MSEADLDVRWGKLVKNATRKMVSFNCLVPFQRPSSIPCFVAA